ncbi:hypothetical protein BU14_0500s0005 [Porphyra umbilicalis]|uniref:Uncharacterized protein n=1 Tax=Porphyra umbilicalis TaxID=2786 RepID=A0A1X6NTH7_PORUM|nr:hypothetical protein BU14_0500s0005 [Porphyra umbilicalis]|eukprot:OSX71806.1 hypothetical protein BU14_0500s0005 [Porphyra umbilicalis]
MAFRLCNRYLRPTATNTARSTSCPAQPPPPGVNALPQPFHLLYRCMASGRASHSPAAGLVVL